MLHATCYPLLATCHLLPTTCCLRPPASCPLPNPLFPNPTYREEASSKDAEASTNWGKFERREGKPLGEWGER